MKAVVRIGGQQFIVTEKETLLVDRLPDGTKELTLDALMVFDENSTTIGTPLVKDLAIKAKVIEDEVKGEKLKVIRYKSKKRVHKIRGHRQQYSRISIGAISTKKTTPAK